MTEMPVSPNSVSTTAPAGGTRLRAFHGTRDGTLDIGCELRPSSTGEFGPGVYLAENEIVARAWGARAGATAARDGEVRVLVVEAEIQRPCELTKLEWIRRTANRTPRQVHARLRAQGYDAIIGIGLNGADRQIVVFDAAKVRVIGIAVEEERERPRRR